MGYADMIYFSYPSFDELVERAHDETDFPLAQRSSRTGEPGGPNRGPAQWYGATWPEASERARHGDIEGARGLKADVLKVTNALLHDKPRLDPVYRVDEGHWLDISRYVKGEPEAWGALVDSTTMTPRRDVAIVLSPSADGDVQAKDLEAIGVKIGGTILALQALGYNIILYVAEAFVGQRYSYVINAPINPSGTPLDMTKVSAMIRPWFLRRILFSLTETFTGATRDDIGVTSGGYGGSASLTFDNVKSFIAPGVSPVVINMSHFIRTPEKVQEYLLAFIKKGNK